MSMPKRAETFNGASSTSKEELNISCAEMLKSRMMYMKTSSSSSSSSSSNTTTTTTTTAATNSFNESASHHHNNNQDDVKSDKAAETAVDSAYHSRVAVDNVCSCEPAAKSSSSSCVACCGGGNATTTSKSVSRKSSGISRVGAIDESSSIPNGTTTTASIPRAHFESMIKFLLNDYIRVKNDNDVLKRELVSRDKTIDVLRKAIDECQVRINLFIKLFNFLFFIFNFVLFIFLEPT